jgi:hypothetical protein
MGMEYVERLLHLPIVHTEAIGHVDKVRLTANVNAVSGD